MDFRDLSFNTETSDDNTNSRIAINKKTTIINLQQDLIGMFQENSKLQKIIYNLQSNKNQFKLIEPRNNETQTTEPCILQEKDSQIKLLETQLGQIKILNQQLIAESKLKSTLPSVIQSDHQEIQKLKQELEQQSDFILELFEARDQLSQELMELKMQLKKKLQLASELQILWDDEKFSNSVLQKRIVKLEEDSSALKLSYNEYQINKDTSRQNEITIYQTKYKDQVTLSEKLQSSLNQYNKDVKEYEFQYDLKSELIQELKLENEQIKEQLKEYQQDCSCKAEQLETLNQKLLTQHKDLTLKDQQIRVLQKNQNTYQMLIKEYSNDLEIQQDSVISLTNKLHQKSTEVQEQNTQILDIQIIEENDREIDLIRQIQILNLDKSIQVNLITTLKSQIMIQNEKITEMSRQSNNQQEELQTQIYSLQEELFNQQMKYELLKEELDTSMELLFVKSKIKDSYSSSTQTVSNDQPILITPPQQYQQPAQQQLIADWPFKKQQSNKDTQTHAETLNDVKDSKNSHTQTDLVDETPSKKSQFELQRLKEEMKCLQKSYQDALESYYFFQSENKKLNDTISAMDYVQKSKSLNDGQEITIKPVMQTQKSQPTEVVAAQGHTKAQPSTKKLDQQSNITPQREQNINNSLIIEQKLESEITRLNDEVSKFKQTIDTLHIQQNDYKQKLDEQSKLIDELQNSQQISLLQQSQSELDKQVLKVSELQEKLNKTQLELTQKSLDYSMIKNVNNFLHRDLEKLRAQEENKV